MGKTRRTYRDALQREKDDWEQIIGWLRQRNQPIYEEIWGHAERHADAAGMANPTNTMMRILVSICQGQQREIAELRGRLDENDS
jgi:hypothetical protein